MRTGKHNSELAIRQRNIPRWIGISITPGFGVQNIGWEMPHQFTPSNANKKPKAYRVSAL
jgi:hypothetical protein